MTDTAAFLAAIAEAPDDDTPRLIFADWLEENGEPERAEFIRVQCALARFKEPWDAPDDLMQREWELRTRHGRRWRTDIPDEFRIEWSRGFIARVHGTADACMTTLSGLRLLPFTDLVVTASGHDALALAHHPNAQRITSLNLHAEPNLDSWLPLLGSAQLRRIRRLRLDAGNMLTNNAGIFETIRRNPAFDSLEEFHLQRSHIDPLLFLDQPRAAPLHSLRIERSYISTATTARLFGLLRLQGLRQLAVASPLQSGIISWAGITRENRLEALEHLELRAALPTGTLRLLAEQSLFPQGGTCILSDNRFNREDLDAFQNADWPARVERLDLSNIPLRQGLVSRLGAVEWPSLRRLNLSGIDLGFLGADLPAQTGRWPRLTGLILSHNRLRSQGVTKLVGAPGLQRVKALDLSHNPLGTNALKAMAKSRYFPELRTLNLASAYVDDEGLQYLLRAGFLRSVRELVLDANRITDRGANLLADPRYGLNLRTLRIRMNALTCRGIQLLAERFGTEAVST